MNRRIRIYELISSFDVEGGGGGLTRFAMTLSRYLNAERFQPVVCALWDRGSEVESQHIKSLQAEGIEVFTCTDWNEQHPYRSFYKAYKGLRESLKIQPADILHSHSEFSDMAVVFLKIEGKAPLLVRTMHNELRVIWKRRPLRRLLFTQFLDPLLFDLELGVSQYIKENLDGRIMARRLNRKALAVPNALDIHRFQADPAVRQQAQRELGIPKEAYVVGSVGRLCEQKGYDVLVEAAARVLQTTSDIYFLIVGEGPNAQALTQQASDLGIAQQVIFAGQRTDVERLLQAMDLFACSSRWEGLSTVLMEAMAAGVPIVATDIPGNRELLRDGENARLMRVEDAAALAEAIQDARSNPELGRVYSSQARRDVQEFGIEQVARQHEQLYWELRQGADENLENSYHQHH
jgi:glycosyltransferase involved in cell wall biosynthesis